MAQIDKTEIYKQQHAHFRHMNDILYKLPLLFSTLIGGLWFFAFSFFEKQKFVSTIVLLFALVLSGIFFFIMNRFRLAFSAYIDRLNNFEGKYKVTLIPGNGPSTISLIQTTLVIAGLLSLIGVIYLWSC